MQDRNFDDLADRFTEEIYGTPKGKLRIETTWEDLVTCIPELENGQPMTILDAGGGMGQISLKLAQMGHHIVLCDISQSMISKAKLRFEREGLASHLTLIHGPLQSLKDSYAKSMDVVLAHGVLEWLAHPQSSLDDLKACLKPGGHISLLFYNVNALIFQNAIKGNFKKVMDKQFAGHETSLTPQNPLNPDDVLNWLEKTGLIIQQITGIRVFYDFIPRPIRKDRTYEDVYAIERRYCRQMPYALLGKYIHLVAHGT